MARKDLEQLSETLIDSAYFMHLTRCYQLDIALNKFYDVYYIFAGANNCLANSSKRENNVLTKKYCCLSTEQEIANELSVSRQSINKTLRSAIKKIRIYLSWGEGDKYYGE